MNGPLYGEQLSFFPELFDDYDILQFDKAMPAGLVNGRKVLTVRAYLSRNKGGMEGIMTNLRTENQKASFYVEGDEVPEGLINQGLYVREGRELYTFVQDNGYSKEGNFHMYLLQIVTGNTDTQKPAKSVNLGLSEYH